MRGKSRVAIRVSPPQSMDEKAEARKGMGLAQGHLTAKSRSQKLGVGVSWRVQVLHSRVLSGQYGVFRIVGGKVKESCLQRAGFLLKLCVAESRGDIKPLASNLWRSQEQMMEAGS